jgi:hypothetical protein
MPAFILFPGSGDHRLVVATVLLSTVLIVLQLANAGAGLA